MRVETSGSYRKVALFLAESARVGELRSVFFAGAHHGAGTTTAVLEVARQLRESFGLKPLVIEWPRKKPQIAAMLGLNGDRTIERCVAEGLPVSECAQKGPHGVMFLPAAQPSPSGFAALSAEGLSRVVEEARADCDIVLVDSPPVLDEPESLVIARAVQQMIFVVRAGRTDEDAIERVQKEMSAESVTIVGAVLNRYRRFIPGWISRWLTN